jgi:predicted kinase
MDLESLDQANASKAIMSAYSEHSGDHQCYSLLDFYSAYRAIVKVKVTCLRSTEVDDPETQSSLQLNAGYYLEQAYRYALQFSRPTLWVFCGLPATGKSALADKLSQTLSMAILKSDRIRKEGRDRFALKEEILPFGQGIYRSAMRQRVYARMLALAQELLKKGQSVILDATFSRTKWREEAMQLATDLDSNVVFLECVCSLKTIKGRLEQREQEQSISDARLSHLHEMVESFEALREIPVEMLVRLDTELPLGRCLLELLAAGYASKCTQVKQVLAGALA